MTELERAVREWEEQGQVVGASFGCVIALCDVLIDRHIKAERGKDAALWQMYRDDTLNRLDSWSREHKAQRPGSSTEGI